MIMYVKKFTCKTKRKTRTPKRDTIHLLEKLSLYCANCGNQASWRDPNCNKCKKQLHQKNCKTKASDCKCHKINEQAWLQKKTPEYYEQEIIDRQFGFRNFCYGSI